MTEINAAEINDATLKYLDNMVSKIPDDMPTFKRIPITKFDREALVKLCILFANEWKKAEENYLSALSRIF